MLSRPLACRWACMGARSLCVPPSPTSNTRFWKTKTFAFFAGGAVASVALVSTCPGIVPPPWISDAGCEDGEWEDSIEDVESLADLETEPPIGVLVCNLGTPDTPTPGAVGTFLKEFLGDRRVVEVDRRLWYVLLNGVIIPRRKHTSAELYSHIFSDEGQSPLLVHGRSHQAKLQAALGPHYTVELGMRYGTPSIRSAVARLKKRGCKKVIVLTAYPQYSGTTSASMYDEAFRALLAYRHVPAVRVVPPYYADPSYIDAVATRASNTMAAHKKTHQKRFDFVLFSFHGIPVQYTCKGDPYDVHCEQTAHLLAKKLKLKEGEWGLAYQSKFGKDDWLEPSTDNTLGALAKTRLAGKTVMVVCPGFVTDCLETVDEIGEVSRELFKEAGGEDLILAPCLNDSPEWVRASADLVRREAQGWL